MLSTWARVARHRQHPICSRRHGTWDRKPTTPPDRPPPPTTPPTTAVAATTPSLQYLLPKDLPRAIRQLQDEELDRLSEAVLAEQKRRGKMLPAPDERSRKQRVESRPISLPSGKLNAVRAAFKAGVKPTQIARQFGISP